MIASVLAAALPLTSCGNEVIVYDALYVTIRSEAPVAGAITRLDIALLSVEDGGKALKLTSATSPDADQFSFPLPGGVNLVSGSYTVRFKRAVGDFGPLALRVLGQDDDLKTLTAYSGVIDTTAHKEVSIKLLAVDAVCDADGDGVRNCDDPACSCVEGEANDCNDDKEKGGAANPFALEDPCTQCGNGIDEDCDGQDIACIDTDKDGVPDCQETQCGAGAEKDPKVYPGAVELCDAKDNDCDGKTDESEVNKDGEGLTYMGIDGKAGNLQKGDTCGKGICAGGSVICDPANDKQLVCSTADKKQDKEICDGETTPADDDCNGKINDGCALQDIDGDGVPSDKEKVCAFKYAHFYADYYPGAPETCCVAYTKLILTKDPTWTPEKGAPPATATLDNTMLSICDKNCDGKVTPCHPKDEDGDGQKAKSAAGTDCDDKDPLSYYGAPEKCGDGKAQGCVGADVPCDPTKDKDGDGWYGKAAGGPDCDDDDKTINPEAEEVCDGVDNDCDDLIDEGNPEAGGKSGPGATGLDKELECGDPDGECGKQRGVRVCKHWPEGQEAGKYACLDKAFAKIEGGGICVGCEGDTRPVEDASGKGVDVCDYTDNDCDGLSDEDYTYKEEASGKDLKIGESCDGVGTCGVGTVECRVTQDKAVCSTDPEGSKSENKPESCDNKDNDCDGKTDEDLTSVTASKCQKVGVCKSQVSSIKTVCVAGEWVCNYAAVTGFEYDTTKNCAPGSPFCHCPYLGEKGKLCFKMTEKSCDGKDNDCSGETDEEFLYDNLGESRAIGKACGTGACADGVVICTKDLKGATCESLGKKAVEVCDGKDNDCNGKTDDGLGISSKDVTCKLTGVCNVSNVVATCPKGEWVCDYSGVGPSYEGSVEKTCDAKDNDCDGKIDEDFTFQDFDGKELPVGAACGTGECKGGNVQCKPVKNQSKGQEMTCSTLIKSATDVCDYKDNDCDGESDEDFKWAGLKIGQECDGVGACGKGKIECTPGKTDAATCSTNHDGSAKQDKPEVCDDADNDCNGKTDEACDEDGDLYCKAGKMPPGDPFLKPKVCPNGGNDCNDKPGEGKAFNPGTPEACNKLDDNCDGKTDEAFTWTQKNLASGKEDKLPMGAACGLGACSGGKVVCDGLLKATCDSLGKIAAEVCDGIDNNCDGRVDEGCDDDGDGYCDAAMSVLKTTTCPKTTITAGKGDDCNDAKNSGEQINPGITEICDSLDNNCDGKKNEGCDDDGDNFCDANMVMVDNTACVLSKPINGKGDDCNDSYAEVNPNAIEVCDGLLNKCGVAIDAGCDDDGDGYCDSGMKVINTKSCPKTIIASGYGDDCNDIKGAGDNVHPNSAEVCNDIDEDCNGKTDEGCDDDGDGWCDKLIAVVGTPKVCPKGVGDCNDNPATDGAKINPAALEICDKVDNDCNGKIDAADPNLGKTQPACENQKGVCQGSNKPLSLCVGGKWESCTPATYKALKGNVYNSDPLEPLCDDLDNDCNGVVDSSCDVDGDNWCAAGKTVVGTPKVCPKGINDCDDNDKNIYPKNKEICSGKDDDCDGSTDEGCDDDKDGYCDDKMAVSSTKACPKTKPIKGMGDDCNDIYAFVRPDGTEYCNTHDDDCNGSTDEGCDDDGDGYCDSAMIMWAQATCAKSDKPTGNNKAPGDDCNDKKSKVNPGAKEVCDGSVDEDCDGQTDEFNAEGCFKYYVDDDKDGFGDVTVPPLCACGPVQNYTTKTTGDCHDGSKAESTYKWVDAKGKASLYGDTCGIGACAGGTVGCEAKTATCSSLSKAKEESCNGIDDDCNAETDEGIAPISCYTGKDGTQGVGLCKAGQKSCVAGKLTGCLGEVLPTTESCDAKDHDCDGKNYAVDAAGCKNFYKKASAAAVCGATPTTCFCTDDPAALPDAYTQTQCP